MRAPAPEVSAGSPLSRRQRSSPARPEGSWARAPDPKPTTSAATAAARTIPVFILSTLVKEETSVDTHYRSVDERGEVRGQEEVHGGNLLGTTETASGQPLEDLRERLGRKRAAELRVDEPGGDGVGGDAVRRELARPGLRHAHDPRLARGVRGL